MLLSPLHTRFDSFARKRPLSPSLTLSFDGEIKRQKRVPQINIVSEMTSPLSMPPPAPGRNTKGLSLSIPPSPRSSLSLSIPPSYSSPPSPAPSYGDVYSSPATAASSPQTPLIIKTPSSSKQASVDSVGSNASYSGYAPLGVGRPVYNTKTSRRPSLLSLISLPPSAGYPSGSAPPTPSVSHSARARATSSPASRLSSFSEQATVIALPYGDGPIEVVPGVWIGAEESATQLQVWAGPSKRVKVINVAKEVPNPYDGTEQVDIDYLHLKWGHGQGELAAMPDKASFDVAHGEVADDAGFWDAIQWMERGRLAQEPILIHCQCGVSRSASLTIAYIMYLACAGTMPSLLGELGDMQNCYEFVKGKSAWIGPNVSLVYQLLEFSRNLCKLLPPTPSRTAFKPLLDAVASEEEWATRRREMELIEAQADAESRRLDREMVERRAALGL